MIKQVRLFLIFVTLSICFTLNTLASTPYNDPKNSQCTSLFNFSSSEIIQKIQSLSRNQLNSFYDPVLIAADKNIEELAAKMQDHILFSNQYKKIINDLKSKRDVEAYNSTNVDYLLLNLYDPVTWRDFTRQFINTNRTVDLSLFFRRKLFINMPPALMHQLNTQLTNNVKFSSSFDKRKTSFRLLSFFNTVLKNPEQKLLRELKLHYNSQTQNVLPLTTTNKISDNPITDLNTNKNKLNSILEEHFNQNKSLTQNNPYRSSNFISPSYFGQIVHEIQKFFSNPEYALKYDTIFIYGSAPSGKGVMESDIDLAFKIPFNAKDELKLTQYLQKKFPEFTSNKERLFDIKIYNKKLLQFLYLSPIAFVIQNQKLFLAVRDQLTDPPSPFQEQSFLFDFDNEDRPHFSITPLKFDLWYFPVQINPATGEWEAQYSKPYFKLNPNQ